MTQQQIDEQKIIEGNILISEFLEDEINANITQVYPKGTYGCGGCYNVESLRYHYCWDWIIPVVEKIEHCEEENNKGYSFHVVIFDKDCHIFEYLEEDETPIIKREASSKIEATWLAVVDFIKWYNQQH